MGKNSDFNGVKCFILLGVKLVLYFIYKIHFHFFFVIRENKMCQTGGDIYRFYTHIIYIDVYATKLWNMLQTQYIYLMWKISYC